MLWALNPFKMILFWGLKKFPLRREIPTLKDHLTLFVVKDVEFKFEGWRAGVRLALWNR